MGKAQSRSTAQYEQCFWFIHSISCIHCVAWGTLVKRKTFFGLTTTVSGNFGSPNIKDQLNLQIGSLIFANGILALALDQGFCKLAHDYCK
jgi:hypothetical protein